jgi:hypothetical protein
MPPRARKKQLKFVRKKAKDKNIILEHGPNLTPFKTFKLPLKRIFNSKYSEKLEDVIVRLNDLVFHSYQFIRGYILHRLGENLDGEFTFQKEFIRYSVRVLGECDGTKKITDGILYEKLEDYYYRIYQPATNHQRTDLTGLSHFTDNIFIEIQTAIENNIKERFIQHFYRFINKMALGREATKEDKPFLARLKKTLLEFRFDEIEPEFHWITNFMELTFPKVMQESVHYDVKRQPWSYLKVMIWMNRLLEDTGFRSFNDLPQRSESIPKCIMITTTALWDYFLEYKWGDKTKARTGETKDEKWGKFLNLNHRIFKSKNYTFYHQIRTDGVSCSLLFIRKDLQNEEGVKDSYSITDLKFPELIHQENPKQYAELLVGCDPGKRSLVYLSDGKRKLQYTAPQRKFESWSGRMQFTIKKMKDKTILERNNTTFTPFQLEQDLNQLRHNSTYHEKFLEYCEAKKVVRNATAEFYQRTCFRSMRLRAWIRGRSSVDRFVNRIGETFGPDCVIAYGDWSRTTQMKGCMPSLGIGLRRIIHRKYKTFSVNEAYTSKRCSKCGHDMENVKGKLRDGSFGPIHRLKCCSGCVSSDNKNVVFRSRDLNAAKNILSIGRYWCLKKQRHPCFESVPYHKRCDVMEQN